MGREQTESNITGWAGKAYLNFDKLKDIQQSFSIPEAELTFAFFLEGKLSGKAIATGRAYIVKIYKAKDLEHDVDFVGIGALTISTIQTTKGIAECIIM